ncbi:hypothetical protein AB0912_17705 [Streptomyces sp. NPDC007084]|uniref:hypothetical protein n=1 Tax=Streptomyces sp. NPDC007084 TaxID=3154313 RepID=UPI00345136D3
MTMWHQDRPLTVSARPAGTYWLDGAESDCRWCCELGALFPADAHTPAATPRTEPVTEPVTVSSVPLATGARAEPTTAGGTRVAPPALARVYGWIDRTRVVIVPVAVATVLAALILVAAG